MRFSNRRLLGNTKSELITSPVLPRVLPPVTLVTREEAAEKATAFVSSHSVALAARDKYQKGAAKKRGNKVPALPVVADSVFEGADLSTLDGLGVNTTVSDIQSRTYMTNVLDEFLPNPDINPYEPPVFMYNIYRDIYYNDTVSGGAVEMMGNLAFSDFNLTGLDEKQMRPFQTSIQNMKVRRLLPQLSTDYLVLGMYPGQMLWDDSEKVYSAIIPHNPSFTYIRPNPIFGVDPAVEIDFSGMMRDVGGSDSRDRRNMAPARYEGLPDEMMTNNRFPVPVDELIYMTRNGMLRDVRGVSYLKRVVPVWLLEKLLIRGTIDQASKRQRGIQHLQVGDDTWTPTAADMRMMADMLSNAALDPVGSVFVTRNGVNVSEIARGDDFWKYPDIYDWASTAKMRALGINEGILSGEASLNTMDMAMSVFVEQVRSHRDTITFELFYERMFPRIAAEHNIRQKKKSTVQAEFAAFLDASNPKGVFERAASYKDFDPNKHVFPRVNWHKRLRPEADEAYLNVLNTLKDNGVPIPIAMWAASGGMDIKSLISGLDEDAAQREKIAEWKAKVSPPEGEEGGGGGGEEASVRGSVRRIGLLERDWASLEEAFEPRNLTSDGKRHPLSAKGKKILTEKILKTMAQAAAQLAKRENAKMKAGK